MTSRDFQNAARQRLDAAKVLFDRKLTLDAQYLGGYAVECSLKALILERTPEADLANRVKQITSGATWHRPEVLLGLLQTEFSLTLPATMAKRMRRFVSTWATDLRYQSGRRDTGETVAFLKTVQAIHEWVEKQLP